MSDKPTSICDRCSREVDEGDTYTTDEHGVLCPDCYVDVEDAT